MSDEEERARARAQVDQVMAAAIEDDVQLAVAALTEAVADCMVAMTGHGTPAVDAAGAVSAVVTGSLVSRIW